MLMILLTPKRIGDRSNAEGFKKMMIDPAIKVSATIISSSNISVWSAQSLTAVPALINTELQTFKSKIDKDSTDI